MSLSGEPIPKGERRKALHALLTDTWEGHAQMAYESADPTTVEARGRSMRERAPSWRVVAAREAASEATQRKATQREALSNVDRLQVDRLRTTRVVPKAGPKPRVSKPPTTMIGAMKRLSEERKRAEKKAAELKTAEMEAAGLRNAHALLAAEDAAHARQARSAEQTKALEAALTEVAAAAAAAELKAAALKAAEEEGATVRLQEGTPNAMEAHPAGMKASLTSALADTALEKDTLLRTPRPTLSKLKEKQTHAEGPAGQNAKWSAAMQVVQNRWELFCLTYEDEFPLGEGEAPSMEMMQAFVTYSFSTRLRGSREGKEGRGDSTDGQHRCASRA